MGFSNLYTEVITKGESIVPNWIPNQSYIQGVNVVCIFGNEAMSGIKNGYYTCAITNKDSIFQQAKWIYSQSIPTLPNLPSNNFQKTQSNINQLFKTVNIWNDQIDTEIKENSGFIIKCPSLLIEFIPEEPKQILGGVTQYPDAKMYFHIYSDQLNSPNKGLLGQNSGDYMDANIEIYELRDIVKSTFLSFHSYNTSAFMSRYDALDYKHKQITKYLLGFSLVFTDDKGSIFDPRSSLYITQVPINASLNPTRINNWISGTIYVAFANVVYLETVVGSSVIGWYICLVSNSDLSFTAANWQELALWTAGTSYGLNAYIYNGDFCYQCANANSDTVFNINNWSIICKI